MHKKYFVLLSMLKTGFLIYMFLLFIFLKFKTTAFFFIKIICNIINFSTVTFDQFNALLLNVSNNFFKTKKTSY